MNYDKETFRQFRKDVEEALKGVAEKYDVEIQAGKISYSDTTFDMKLMVQDAMSAEERFMDDYNHSYLFAYPITADMLNKKFKGNDGYIYTLTGIKRTTTRTNNVLEITNTKGTTYICKPEFLGITQKGLGGSTGNRID